MSRRRNRRNKNVNKPAAKSVQVRNTGAMRTMRINHTEYIGYISVSPDKGDNQISKFEIQPGSQTTFPWLSSIARRFESYKFNRLSFKYIPDVGTTTDGSIALCPDYDASDDNSQASRATLLTFEDSVRGPLWDVLVCRATPRNLKKRTSYYTRTTQPSATDIKLYDVGNLWVSLKYQGDLQSCGELWVSYDITLITPQLEENVIAQKTANYPVNIDPAYPFLGMAEAMLEGVSINEDFDGLQFTKPGIYHLAWLIRRTDDGDSEPVDIYNPNWKIDPSVYQAQGDSFWSEVAHYLQEDHHLGGVSTANTGERLEGYITVGNETTPDHPTIFEWLSTARASLYNTPNAYERFLTLTKVGTVPSIIGLRRIECKKHSPPSKEEKEQLLRQVRVRKAPTKVRAY